MNFIISLFAIAAIAGGVGIILGSNNNTLDALGLVYYWQSFLCGGVAGLVIFNIRFRKNIRFRDTDYIFLVIFPIISVFGIPVLAKTFLKPDAIGDISQNVLFEYTAYFYAFFSTCSIALLGITEAKPKLQDEPED